MSEKNGHSAGLVKAGIITALGLAAGGSLLAAYKMLHSGSIELEEGGLAASEFPGYENYPRDSFA